jgi:hypothetical protein
MRNTYSFLLASLLLGALFVGCEEKPVTTPGDLENPKIIMTSPVELPLGQYIEIYSTDSFFVDIRFEDDKALKSWEITVRINSSLYYLRTNNQPWKETWFGALSGTSGAVNFKEYVSYDPTAGPYEFQVTVTDSAGKTATRKTYFFVHNRVNLDIPVVTYSSPDTNNIDTFSIGQQIPIMAEVFDASDQIKDVYLRIRDKVTKNTMENSEIRWDTIYAAPAIIDTFVTVPAGTVPGNYNIEIYGNDQTYNLGYKACEIYIKPN